MARTWIALLSGLLLFGALSGCSKQSRANNEPTGARLRSLPPIEITRNRGLVFTYRLGTAFNTVQSIDDVPAPARSWVRVQDPDRPAVSTDLVYVADLRKADAKGRFPYSVMTRKAFETGRPAPGASTGPPRASPGMAPTVGTVILYSRPGCSACEATRIYLKQRGIPFVEKNVQSDPAAARELARKAAAKGVPTNVVPVIDVNGELVVGFDTKKLEALLRRQI